MRYWTVILFYCNWRSRNRKSKVVAIIPIVATI